MKENMDEVIDAAKALAEPPEQHAMALIYDNY